MSVPQITADAFFEHLGKSGLVTGEWLTDWQGAHPHAQRPPALQIARGLVNQGVLTRYQAEQLLEGKPRGFFIEQYRKLELLGAGGMSFLYLALDQRSGDRFALKVVTEKFRAEPGMLARLKLEARAGALIRHPNVVRTYAMRKFSDVFGENHYLVMQFVEGVNLEEFAQIQGTIPWPQACDFGRQAAEGLGAAHRAGVIHRDVKPANLLVDRAGVVRVLDFGLALLESREDADEYSLAMIFGHDCLGTADYISPEQSIDSLRVDVRADVYSLGATLYTVFCGQPPFPVPATPEKIRRHREQIPRPITQLVPDLPAEVGQLVDRMLAKDPADRPQTMEEIIRALARYAVGRPIEFEFPRILAYRASQARKRLRSLTASAVARGGGSEPSRNQSHWTTTATRELPRVSAESAISEAAIREAEQFGPTPLSPDLSFGAAVPEVAKHPRECVRLRALNGGPPIFLLKDRVVVGRSLECDVVIADTAISGHHCEFRQGPRGWALADLGSKNGVTVNSRLLTGAGSEFALQPGDRITIGQKFKYQFPGEAAPRKSAGAGRRLGWYFAAGIALAVVAVWCVWWWIQGRSPPPPTP